MTCFLIIIFIEQESPFLNLSETAKQTIQTDT